MAIANAVQRGGYVLIYDEQGIQLAGIAFYDGDPSNGLTGYTSTSVNVRNNGYIFQYNEQGQQTGAVPV